MPKTTGPLALSTEQMNELGGAVVDRLVRHYEALTSLEVGRVASPSDLERLQNEPMPRGPAPPARVLEQLDREVWSNILHIHHPRFWGFITSPSTFVGAMADGLASGINPFAGTWLEGSGPAAVELAVMGWLREWMELPSSWRGHFTAGGSAANLTALAVARHAAAADRIEGAVLYCSSQTHSSMKRALWLLGIPGEQVRALPADPEFRLDPDALARAVEADRSTGLRPWCVVANAGTTNTGAVDPLEPIADLCRDQDLWLHVDGCYGLAAAYGERRHARFRGLERADSLSIDPHKWLFQPYECGCVMLRDPSLLARAFQARPEYMQDAEGGSGEISFGEEGLQLTRRFRALKLWMTFKIFGADALREAVEGGIELGRFAAKEIERRDGWELVAHADLGIVAFGRDFGTGGAASDRLHRTLVARFRESGIGFVSSSVLHGRVVLRMNTINPWATEDDVRRTLDGLEGVAEGLG